MDTEEHDDKPVPAPDISSDGDVILVVGPRSVRFKIQSQCLRCASKVFDAMFKPQWIEGQGLSRESPWEILLVEDNADALRIICFVIHHRNDDVPQSLSPNEILQIAIEADKYDLSVALKYASIHWLKPRYNAERVDMGYLLAAAFLFGDVDIFVAHTLTLMLHYNGSYLAFLDDEFTSQIVPRKTFYLLEERRTRMRAELGQLLILGKNAGCSCGWGKNRSDIYTQLLSEYTHLEILEAPLSDIVKKMENFSLEDMDGRWHSGFGGYYHEALTHDEAFHAKLETIKKKASICLECVRSGDPTMLCRFQHS